VRPQPARVRRLRVHPVPKRAQARGGVGEWDGPFGRVLRVLSTPQNELRIMY
jgi:hypothetical protein